MNRIISSISRFFRNEEGLELSEYAVAGALIVLGTVGAFQLLGGNITTVIETIANTVSGAGAGG